MKALPSTVRKSTGFSIIELLVSVAVLSLVMVLVFQMLERTQSTFKKARDSVSEFKDARNGFDAITRRLSQATLNTFWQVANNANGVATKFERQSDLHFVSGPATEVMGNPPANAGKRVTHSMFFQAPTGYTEVESKEANSLNTLKFGNFPNLLNAWGYFVEFGSDQLDRAQFLNNLENAPRPRIRYRLMEYAQATEGLQIYAEQLRTQTQAASTQINKWFLNADTYGVNNPRNYDVVQGDSNDQDGRTTRVIAENIIALLILPAESLSKDYRDKLAPNYSYNTRAWQTSNGSALAGSNTNVEKTKHVLPPIVDVTMVAVDEADFRKVTINEGIESIAGFSKVDWTQGLFARAADYDRDIDQLRQRLSEHTPEIKFRVFRASVRLREAKWGGFVDPATAATN